MSLEETILIIQKLREFILSTYPIDEIRSTLKELKRFPAHVTEFHEGNVVYRIRPNENEQSFTSMAELSYKPQKYNTSFQRASHPNQTMFYGSIIPLANKESEIDIGRLIAMTEGSKLFRDGNIKEGQERVTFGMWRLQDTVSLATILHPNIDNNISPYAKERAAAFMEWLSGYPDFEEQGKIILRFYAEEFAKLVEIGDPDYNYLHSAILTDLMIEKGFHGVCYPSGRVDGKGINVAIHPDFVNAHMKFEAAMECVLAKRDNHIVCINLKVAWVNAGQDELIFHNIIEPDQIDEAIEKGFSS